MALMKSKGLCPLSKEKNQRHSARYGAVWTKPSDPPMRFTQLCKYANDTPGMSADYYQCAFVEGIEFSVRDISNAWKLLRRDL